MKTFQTLVRTKRAAATAALVVVVLTVSMVVPLRAAAQKDAGTIAATAGPRADTDRAVRSTVQPPPVSEASGSVATPIGTTYSVHHMVGADVDGNSTVDCRMINDDPPPDAIVVYDGLPETITTDIFGTVPTVTESKIDHGGESHLLVIDTSSPFGTDLFPEGVTDPDTGMPLTDACFIIGLVDPLDWPGQGIVTSASITFRSSDIVVVGPVDVTGPSYFNEPWTGVFGMTVADGAGLGINSVHLEIASEKTSQEPLGACCLDGQCVGDTVQISCEFQGGIWHVGASCGADPALPPPVCDQATCQFNNGLPLDDGGAPVSQFAPDGLFGVGAADDFILRAPPGFPCRINLVQAWVTHSVTGVEPGTDYMGVNVTIYADSEPKGPAGQPEDDGSHTPDYLGGIVYTQMITTQAIAVTPLSASCTLDHWQLDIPVDIMLQKNTKYWLEVQPVMDSSIGQVLWLLSENNNDHPAQQIAREFGVTNWQVIPGNTDACPDATPPAGTRTNLAFHLFGEEILAPPNNDCANSIPVGDGVMPFSNVGATTDGGDDPLMCDQLTYIKSDIWFDYIAPCSGDLTVSLCGSEYDTNLAVYHGCDYCPPRGDPVACNEDYCGTKSQVTFPAVEDHCYKIRIGGWLGAQGNGIMTIDCYVPPPPTGACCDQWGDCIGTMSEADCDAENGTWFEGQNCDTFTCPVAPPPHDDCPTCIPVVSGVPYNGSTRGATGSDTSSCSVNDTKDVWHCWTPDCTGTAIISLCDSAFDTTLAVYDSCGGNELVCSDDYCGTQGRASLISPQQQPPKDLPVTAGETYYIRVSGTNNDLGNYTLAVGDCANACCFPQGKCHIGTPEQCELVNGTLQGPGSVCWGDSDVNGIDDICEQQPDTWFWKDFNGEEPGGYMPDFDQNKDYDNADGDGDPTTGIDPFYCGPTAVANSLWWFQGKYPDLSIVPLEYTKLELIEHLAELMGTNGTPGHPSPNGHPGSYAGTFIDDMQSGTDAYLTENSLADLFYEHTATQPSYQLVVDELTRDQDVTLLLGFYHIEGADPVPDGFVVHWRRTGGHYVTVAGVDSVNGQIAISDPDADAAEEGGHDYVRGDDHDHDGDGDPMTRLPFRDPTYDHTKHNDTTLASHDVYDAMPSFGPGGSWIVAVDGDPLIYGDLLAEFHEGDAGGASDAAPTFVPFEFLEQQGYPPPVPCQTYTIVEHAVIVSPFEVCPEATIVDAIPPDGVVDARQPNTPSNSLPRQGIGSADEPITITLDPATDEAEHCFTICETAADVLLDPNAITSVTYLGNGQYKIVPDHAITAGAVTTIQYMGDGSFVEYTSHPANVNADSQSAPSDILRVIDYINGVATSPWGIYSEDVDHSGLLGPPDILRVIDLLNGAGVFDSWLNTPLPVNTSCP